MAFISLTVKLPPQAKERVTMMADVQQATMSEIVRMAIDYLWQDMQDEARDLKMARERIAAKEPHGAGGKK